MVGLDFERKKALQKVILNQFRNKLADPFMQLVNRSVHKLEILYNLSQNCSHVSELSQKPYVLLRL